MTATQFDPVKYKQTTHEQWQSAAEAWHRWTPTIQTWLAPVTTQLSAAAGIHEGTHVLDVAAGAGDPSVGIAELVGPAGSVTAADISSNLLNFAAAEAAARGLSNYRTHVVDGEQLDFPDDAFDAVISRVGLIYFPDQLRALQGMQRVLKPGGLVANAVYSTADRNGFFSIPVGIIRERAKLPPPLPGQPGLFSLGGEGVLAGLYEQAGFRDIAVQVVPAPLRMPSAAECLRFERESFGALHAMLVSLNAEQREAVWAEIERALEQFEGPDGFVAPGELLVVSGVK